MRTSSSVTAKETVRDGERPTALREGASTPSHPARRERERGRARVRRPERSRAAGGPGRLALAAPPSVDHGSAAARTFVGECEREGRRVWIEEAGGARRLPHRDADDMVGFVWGRQGLAARELAYAILSEATGSEVLAEALCREFTWEVVAAFPAHSFRLSQAEVEEWIDRRPTASESAVSEPFEGLSARAESGYPAPGGGSYVEGCLLLGRSSLSDICLPDPTVSRLHAAAHRTDEGWVLRDLGSKNGVAVNGHRVQHATVRPGDLVTMGDVAFHWCPESRPAEAA